MKNKYYRTIKSKGSRKTRQEKEWEIPQDEFRKEFQNIVGNAIIKTRYRLKDNRFNELCIDIYERDLKPLVVGKVEFITHQDSIDFKEPK